MSKSCCCEKPVCCGNTGLGGVGYGGGIWWIILLIIIICCCGNGNGFGGRC